MSKSIKPRLAKGTRDFSPEDMSLRNYIMDVIRTQFKCYGYVQIETPAVENLETLTGKYGEEGEKLIFKILNSGDFLKGANSEDLQNQNSEKIISQISEKALRYDLTVPFARYVVQHRNDISFPFRRYQMQPVWRADRPQKGRYREFYQCDADVIGSNSLLMEAEFVNLIDGVFKELEINATIKLNSRKVLYGFCEANGIEKRFIEFTTILDKLDKRTWQDIITEFREKNFMENLISNTATLKDYTGLPFALKNIEKLESLVGDSAIGKEGIIELKQLLGYLNDLPVSFVDVKLDLTLARGLNYYTGAIIEVLAKDHEMGSICGGGRYDDLTGIFGMPDVSGIGSSFGIDRIFDILKIQGWRSQDEVKKVMLVNLGDASLSYNLNLLKELRNAGIQSEIFPDNDKLKKQFKYADQKGFHFVIVAGSDEQEKNIFSLKDLKSGDQKDVEKDKVVQFLINS